MSDAGSPELPDLIREAITSEWLNLYVASVGIVQSYDSAKETCSVQPAIKRPLPLEDGTWTSERLPVIDNVPVTVFGSPKLSVKCELAKGDAVLLVYLDHSPAAWRKSGAVSEPHDTRGHGPAYPVAIPWMRPSGAASADGDNTAGAAGGVRVTFKAATIEIGNGSDFVAMAAKVNQELNDLKSAISSWVPVPNDGGAALKTALATWFGTPAAVDSGNLKAD